MQTFLELLARNALGAALLAGVVLALMPIVRRPAARNALWLIVFARLFLPPIWSIPLMPAREAPANQSANVLPTEAARPTEPAPDVALGGAELSVDGPHDAAAMLPMAEGEIIGTDESAAEASRERPPLNAIAADNVGKATALSAAATEARALPAWLVPMLFGIWLTGYSVVVVLAIVRIRRFERGLRDAVMAPTDVQEQTLILARRMGLRRSPSVWLVPGRVPPMLWMSGLFTRKARLILPTELFLRLDMQQRSALIAHELAHLRRGDPWVRWLELLAIAVYWWFPLLVFFRRQLRESEEQCCDGWVVALLSERKAYATALVETVDYLDRPDLPATPALASGASPVHNLQRRLTMIMRGSAPGRLTRFGALAALGVAVGALAFGPAFSRAQQDPPREKRERPARGEDPVPPRADKERPGRGEGGEFQPKGPNRFQPREGREELERARLELQKAREDAERAMRRVHELEQHIQRLTGGREAPRFPGPMGGGPGGPGPMVPMGGGPGGPGPMAGPGQFGPGPMGGDGGFRPERQMQEMQRQIEEMRRMIEELRREINRGPGGPDRGPMPKGQGDRRRGFGPDGYPGRGPGDPGGPGGSPGRPGAPGPEKAPQPPEKDN